VEGKEVGHRRVPRLGHCNFQFRHEHGQLLQDELSVPRVAGLEHAPAYMQDVVRLTYDERKTDVVRFVFRV
jgi:hypothetical protein